MGTEEQREAVRTPMRCRIRLWHDVIGEVDVFTRDISDTGVFLLTEESTELEIGTIVKGQIQGLPMEAPILEMEVVRLAPEGMGLRYCL